VLADEPPPEDARDGPYLVRRAAPPGTLAGDIVDRSGSATDFETFLGTLTVTRIGATSARIGVSLRSDHTPPQGLGTCSLQRGLTARRAPGRLYVGATSDREPVWVRRRSGGRAEVRIGYGTRCRPRGVLQGVLDESPAVGRGRFGDVRLAPHAELHGFDARVALSGRLRPARARGSLRIVGRDGPGGAERCDTGRIRWQARSG
jgi:hypothetical protein